MTEEHERAADVLRAAGYQVKAPLPPRPEPTCSNCGTAESESAWGMLVDVTVVVADGEEGYSRPERRYCDDCFPAIQDGLIALGFGVHAHGGICFLEPRDCPGYDRTHDCPTPESQYPGEDD